MESEGTYFRSSIKTASTARHEGFAEAVKPDADEMEKTAKEVLQAGTALRVLTSVNTAYKKVSGLGEYLGNFRDHPSYFNRTGGGESRAPAVPQHLPAFSQMMGNIHVIYRSKIPMKTALSLDLPALDVETRETIEAVRKNIDAFKAASEAVMRARGAKSIDYNDLLHEREIVQLLIQAKHLSDRLSESSLRDKNAKIPIIMGNKRIVVVNSDRIAAKIYALGISSEHQVDHTKVPTAIQDYIIMHVGTFDQIHRDFHASLHRHPPLLAHYNEVVAGMKPEIITAVTKAKQPLQVLNLLGETTLCDFQGASRQLLAMAGQPEYPECLQSPEECVLVIRSMQQAADAAVGSRLNDLLGMKPDSLRGNAQAASILADIAGSGRKETPLFQKQRELVMAFISPHHRARNVAGESKVGRLM